MFSRATPASPIQVAGFVHLCGQTANLSTAEHGAEYTDTAHQIRFAESANKWIEALPLGNGIVGAMSHSRVGAETLTLNRQDAWSGSKDSPLQTPTAFQDPEFLHKVRDLIATERLVDAEKLLKNSQSTHTQAFLPYFDVDISVSINNDSEPVGRQPNQGTNADPPASYSASPHKEDSPSVSGLDLDVERQQHFERQLDFRTATASSTYLLGTTRICHSTHIPRTHDSNDNSFVIHSIANHGAQPISVNVSVSSLLRSHSPSAFAHLVELPEDVAPTHEPAEEHVRYTATNPRFGVLTIGYSFSSNEAPLNSEASLLSAAYQYSPALSANESHPHTVASSTKVFLTEHEDLARDPRPTLDLFVPAHTTLVVVFGLPQVETATLPMPANPTLRGSALIANCASSLEKSSFQSMELAQTIAASAVEMEGSGSQSSSALVTPHGQHVIAHRKMYDSMTFSVSDFAVTRQLNFGRYLMISGYAPEANPLNLQGLWCHELPAPWSSNYTLNINTPMNYWGVEAAGLPQVHVPLLEWLLRVARGPGSAAAKNLYGLDGFVLHHNSDAWGHALPVGAGDGDVSWAYWPMGALWLTRHAWDHYDYSRDARLLDAVWTLVESAGLFVSQWIEVNDGAAKTSPSVSPENRYVWQGNPIAVSESVTMDIALIKDFARYAVEAHDAMFGGATTQPQWLRSLVCKSALLPDYQVGSRGELLEWQNEFPEVESDHRHLSHLVGVYPLGSWHDRQDLLAAAAQSLFLRGDDSTGWSLAWRIALWARLGNSEMVADAIERSLRPALRPPQRPGLESAPEHVQDQAHAQVQEHELNQEHEHRGGIYPNLFSAHPPFQIDGNLGFVAGVLEAICSTHGASIVVFGGRPTHWDSGALQGVRLRGSVSVDASWTSKENYYIKVSAHKRYPPKMYREIVTPHGSVVVDLLPQQTIEIAVENGAISTSVTIF